MILSVIFVWTVIFLICVVGVRLNGMPGILLIGSIGLIVQNRINRQNVPCVNVVILAGNCVTVSFGKAPTFTF